MMPRLRRSTSDKPTKRKSSIFNRSKKLLSSNSVVDDRNTSRFMVVQRPSTITASTENTTLSRDAMRSKTPPARSSCFVPPPQLIEAVSTPQMRPSQRKSMTKEHKKSFFSERTDIFIPNEKSDLIDFAPPRRRAQRQPVYSSDDQIEKRMSELLCKNSVVQKKSYNPPCHPRLMEKSIPHEDKAKLSEEKEHENGGVEDRVILTVSPTTNNLPKLTKGNLPQHHNIPAIIFGRPTLQRIDSISSVLSDITLAWELGCPQKNDNEE